MILVRCKRFQNYEDLHLSKPNCKMNVGRNEVIDAIPRHSAPYMIAVK